MKGYVVAPTSLTFSPRTVLLESKNTSPDGYLGGLVPGLSWRNGEGDIEKGYVTGPRVTQGRRGGLRSVLNSWWPLFFVLLSLQPEWQVLCGQRTPTRLVPWGRQEGVS